MDDAPRLKTSIRVAALIRRAQGAGAFALVAQKGDPDAGAIAVKVFLGKGEEGASARLFVASRDLDGRAIWREAFDAPQSEEKIDARLARERRIDPDLWIVEIEDAHGRSFLD
jgi:hypothetical protein